MKIFSIALLAFILSGCSLFGPRIEDNRPDPVIVNHTTQIAYTCPEPPLVDNVTMRDIEWDVVSRKELDAVILELMNELSIPEEEIAIINQVVGDFFFHPDDEVRWSLNADDYADLGRNTSDVLAALKQMKAIAQHYKKCINDSEDAVRRANEQLTEPAQ